MAITEGLLAVCTWDEVRGVLAHELAHVRNRDILIGSVAAAVATGISFIANLAMWGAMLGGGDDEDGDPLALLVAALVAPMAAGLLQMALSRNRKSRPTAPAPRSSGRASRWPALWRSWTPPPSGSRWTWPPPRRRPTSSNPLTGRNVRFADLFRTHPTTAERVARSAGSPPPRPSDLRGRPGALADVSRPGPPGRRARPGSRWR